MKKLFKEVWKSFSKSKVILTGLTFLVFLTSGIITLLSDVVNTYNNQYNDYKRTSQLQDLTMNANIEPSGSKPQNVYLKNNTPNIWESTAIKSPYLDSIRVNTNSPYIDLNSLNTSYAKGTFVGTKELAYLLNSNLSSITIPNNGTNGVVFTPNKNQINQLIQYQSNANIPNEVNIKYGIVNNIISINKVVKKSSWLGSSFTKTKTNLVKDLFLTDAKNPNNPTNKFNALIVDSLGNAFIEDDIFLESNIQEAKLYQSSPSAFYRIDSDVVAKWFGFTKTNINDEFYTFSEYIGINNILVGDILPGTISKPMDISNRSFKDGFATNLNNAITNPIKIPFTIVLDSLKPLNIPNNWFIYSQEISRYERVEYTLNIDENLTQWYGMYKQYLEHIKNNDQNLWTSLQKTSYWKKTLTNNFVDFNNTVIKTGTPLPVSLTAEDLNKPLNSSNQTNPTSPTILSIENINLNNVPPLELPSKLTELASELNKDQHTLLENKIENNSKDFAYKKIYQQIKDVVNQIGIRENITIKSNSNSETQTFQFINIGNSNQELKWNNLLLKQQVGNLVNNADESQIYSLKSNIENTNKIPQKYLPKILDKLLHGLSIDRNYINPMISFQTFEYQDEQNITTYKSNAKIIWLTPNGANERKNLEGLSIIRSVNGPDKYYFLKEKTPNSGNWQSYKMCSTYEEMEEHVLTKNLSFASFDYKNENMSVVGNKGWLIENNNYSDQFYVPFQYLMPSAAIIDDYNNNHSLRLFSDNLILKLTELVKPIINANTWEILMKAVDTGFTSAGFGEGLTPPAALTNQTIAKIIIYTLKDAVVATNQNFMNSFLTNIFQGIQRQMNAYAQNDLAKMHEFLINEFNKLSFILNITTGINISSYSTPIIKSLKDPNMFFDAIVKIINSFDLDNAILQIYNEVSSVSRPSNQIISSGDYLPILYLNLKNSTQMKNGLSSLVLSIDLQQLSSIPGFEAIKNIINFISPSTINLINFENPSVGYSKLLQKIQYIKTPNNIIYKQIGQNSLKSFLNLLYVQVPLLGKWYIGDLIPNLPNMDVVYNPNEKNPLELDLDQLWYLKNFVLTEKEGNIFGVNTADILLKATSGFVEIKNDNNQIVLEENAAKIALVNEAFLQANNKQIYKSRTLDEDINNLNNIDEKYKISINNVEYLIVGSNLTVDYMYPVINAENIQVSTKNQALVYVNQFGYDRIKRSNINAPTDKYFLLSNPKNNLSINEAQAKLNQMAYYWATNGGNIDPSIANSSNNPYKKAYLASESSLQYPERSLRINTINKVLSTLQEVQKIIGIMLATITAIVISFVVRRYIASRAKVIGILKAQGYKSIQIALSICLFPLLVSLIGGTLGYIAGHFAQFGVFKTLSLFWTIPISIASFNWITLILSIIVPFVFLSVLTIIVTLWFLRKNPIKLMNGSLEINDSKFAYWTKQQVSNTSIKNKFSVSLTLSSIGKLVALFISALITSSITLFSVTTFNIFNTSVKKTYQNKNYTYKTDLITPTKEGGEYSDICVNPENQIINQEQNTNINNALYVPLGNVQEGYTYLKNYFKPGYNEIINQKIKILSNNQEILVDANGTLLPDDTTTPHILTKSSVDLTVKAGGLSINVWENLYNAIPESQRASIIEKSQDAAAWLEWTQEGEKYQLNPNDKKTYLTKFVNFNLPDEYLTLFDPDTNQIITNNIKIPYFEYQVNKINPEKSHFVFKAVNNAQNYYDVELVLDGVINNNTIRDKYRKFLVNGYTKMINWNNNSVPNLPNSFNPSPMPKYTLDYFIVPGANMFNKSQNLVTDEKYTYIDAKNLNKDQNIRIYGYNPKSNYIKILNSYGDDLLSKIENYQIQNNTYPIAINEVVHQKYGINVGDQIDLIINNDFYRFQDKLKQHLENTPNQRKIKVIVVGISDTYINEEWITTQKIANSIIRINSYNGIITNKKTPIQIANSLSLYAPSGYWSAKESINNVEPIYLSNADLKENSLIYKQLFYLAPLNQPYQDEIENNSLVAQNIKSLYYDENSSMPTNSYVNLKIKEILGLGLEESLDINNDDNKIYQAINKFTNIYTNKLLQASFVDATSNSIEKEFALNASSTINEGMLIISTIAFAMSLVILVMISVMIINENERNIAIFGILGYTTKEKIRMFFSIYIPIVAISLLLSILLVWLFIPVFSSSVLMTSSIALPLGLSLVRILISSIIITFVFSITCIFAWLIQGRVKPIILLKGV